MSPTRNLLGPDERRLYGGIAVLMRGGEDDVRHWPGADWLQAVCAYCDRGGWRVRCLSTPTTIYRDLQGHRIPAEATNRRHPGSSGTPDDRLALPELILLGRLGRLDLLERP